MASEIKVNNIKDTCGTAVITKCGATHTVTAEVYKANTIQDTSGNAYLAKCGTTVTLGGCGQTIELASGASQTGFGRTGTVDWDTTAKTASFTAVSGTGYFVNTTSSAFTATLPAGSAGAIVSFADYAGTWQTNALTVSPQSGEKIGGTSADVALTTEGQSVTFIYVDSTQGWLNTMDSTSNVRGNPFIVATGGTITCCGDYKIHTFTGPGTFTVTNAGAPTGSNTVDYLVAAGAGAGGSGDVSGGGGAGGYRESSGVASGCYTASPLGAGVAALPVSTASPYPITVGGGGTGSPWPTPGRGGQGSNSIFSTITSTGGGGGGGNASEDIGGPGGSGGGSNYTQSATSGNGNTPPVSPPQGQNGGFGAGGAPPSYGGGGGGGAGGAGTNGTSSSGGPGGCGAFSNITGSPVGRSGGGGGASESPQAGAGAAAGGNGGTPSGRNGANGAANRASGGGGGDCGTGGSGGSGIVIIRYKFQ